jgi:large subunit ribosomal protein L1
MSEQKSEKNLLELMKDVKAGAKAKFDESVEVHINLNIDPKKSDQQVRGLAELPNGTGKKIKIIAFTSTKKKEAEDAGADLVGGEELIDKIKTSGKVEADIALATPEMMPKLAMIAKILGPRGLMPNPKSQTVTEKIKETIESLQKGRADFKNDNTGNIHQIIGKVSFDEKKLEENFRAFIDALKKSRPEGAKGKFIKKIFLSSTMGKSVQVDVALV